MAKKGFLATLFGGGGKRSSGSRASKGRSKSSSSKARSSASKPKRTVAKPKSSPAQAKRKTKSPSQKTTKNKKGLIARFFDWLSGLFTKKKKSDVGKIYWTNDGYFTQHPNEKRTKERRVAVVDQREKDGALAVTKIYSKYNEKNEERKGNAYIDDLTLYPKDHSSLKRDSIVGNQVYIGTRKAGAKTPEEKNFQPILKGELQATSDKLTAKELKTIKKKIQNDTPKHRSTYEKKMKKWRSGFKEDK